MQFTYRNLRGGVLCETEDHSTPSAPLVCRYEKEDLGGIWNPKCVLCSRRLFVRMSSLPASQCLFFVASVRSPACVVLHYWSGICWNTECVSQCVQNHIFHASAACPKWHRYVCICVCAVCGGGGGGAEAETLHHLLSNHLPPLLSTPSSHPHV